MHELTEKVHDAYKDSENIDKIIRVWLEEKAELLIKYRWTEHHPDSEVRLFLGLTEKPEKTLEEKFGEVFDCLPLAEPLNPSLRKKSFKLLAQIAKEHYESK